MIHKESEFSTKWGQLQTTCYQICFHYCKIYMTLQNANCKMWNANCKLLNIYILLEKKTLTFQINIFIRDYYHRCCIIVNMTFVENNRFLKLIKNNIKVMVLTSFVNLIQAGIILEETASIEKMNSLNCLVSKHIIHFLDW